MEFPLSKLPSIQFYPGDWKKDPGVQSLDYETRGIWFEILLLMFESEQRGKLLLNGKPMPEKALAQILGLDNQKTTTVLTMLLEHGVAAKEPDTGIFFSRRMVRDEEIRVIRKNCGKLGGNPNLVNQNSTTEDNQNSTPSKEDEKEESVGVHLPPLQSKPKTSWQEFFPVIEKHFGKPTTMYEEKAVRTGIEELTRIGTTGAKLEKRILKYREAWPTTTCTLKAILSNWNTIPTLQTLKTTSEQTFRA